MIDTFANKILDCMGLTPLSNIQAFVLDISSWDVLCPVLLEDLFCFFLDLSADVVWDLLVVLCSDRSCSSCCGREARSPLPMVVCARRVSGWKYIPPIGSIQKGRRRSVSSGNTRLADRGLLTHQYSVYASCSRSVVMGNIYTPAHGYTGFIVLFFGSQVLASNIQSI